jgi:hypothetical protein
VGFQRKHRAHERPRLVHEAFERRDSNRLSKRNTFSSASGRKPSAAAVTWIS